MRYRQAVLGYLATLWVVLHSMGGQTARIDPSPKLPVLAAPLSLDAIAPEDLLELPLPGIPLSMDLPFARSAGSLHFERNEGQADAAIKFLARGRGYQLFVTPTEAAMVLKAELTGGGAERLGLRQPPASLRLLGPVPKSPEYWRNSKTGGEQTVPEESPDPVHVVRMQLVGANLSAPVLGEEIQHAKVNYFIGNEPSRWQTNIPTFGKVRLQEVYPGVNLVFYGKEGELEYDFIVAPGADPNRIVMQIDGADKTEVDERTGDLVLNAGGREIRWRKPLIYQEAQGVRHEIAGTYRLTDSEATYRTANTHKIGFELAAYDQSRALVIDPVLVYSTYLGGLGSDEGTGIVVDADGNAYVTGTTKSLDFPTKAALNTVLGGTSDAFVSKFSPAGELLFSTYLGGSLGDGGFGASNRGKDQGFCIAVSPSGVCYVAGATLSTNFPLLNPIQTAHGGQYDTFITALTLDGSALLFSTCLGGAKTDWPTAIALHSSSLYLVGYTTSTNFPVQNALQPELSIENDDATRSDGYITKLEADGKRILYSTYYGTAGAVDYVDGVVVDDDANALIVGRTFHNSSSDLVFAKLTPDGSNLVYASTFGGSGYENDAAIALDQKGRFTLVGRTDSPDLPAINPPNVNIHTYVDAFVAQFNTTDGSFISAVYLGGGCQEYPSSLAVDQTGNIYIFGSTCSADFPTRDALQPSLKGGSDVFLTKLRADDLSVTFSTFLGGTGGETAGKMALDSSGNILITGSTTSTNEFPLIQPVQASLAGGQDAFVVKIRTGEVLKVSRSGPSLVFSWPASTSGYKLESSSTVGPGSVWGEVVTAPIVIGDQQTVPVDITAPAQFFRLRKP